MRITKPNFKIQIKSKEIRQFATVASVTLTIMKCQTCVDEYYGIKKTEKPPMLIGFVIGLVLGVGFGVILFLNRGDADAAQADMLNQIIGPVIAFGSIVGLFGLIIGKIIWNLGLNKETRLRMKELETPVSIVDFGYETGLLGNVKDAILKLHFSNVAYGQSFLTLNGFQVE